MGNYAGHLLVSTPNMHDLHFAKTVTLVIRQEEEGTLGFILNKPSSLTIKEAWKQASKKPDWDCPSEKPIFSGGPVNWAMTAVHTHEPLAEAEILPGLYVCMKRKRLRTLIEEDHEFRIFSGCANWSPGQLGQEMLSGAWLVKLADKNEIFGDHYDLWKNSIKTIGNEFYSSIGLKVPLDTKLN